MEKAGEVASLRRDIASNSEVKREAKSLKLQVSELKEDKRLCMAPIDKLEVELRDVELQHVEADGFTVERYVSRSFRQRKFSAAPSTQRPARAQERRQRHGTRRGQADLLDRFPPQAPEARDGRLRGQAQAEGRADRELLS